ncbi:VOC family protein [Thermomonospora umbrina]|uniref:Glyoxalase/bleomycin resistance protein/dioxygenase superfamily protein n=1 Tax=Thermomonospora umbrina TaxID=111806 RepID=A0A3D9SZR0_9ACTN|nr:VOC family protein [Thermomonospora umbrina]REE98054.1 glyoxalase/bleomycin resistance protein/dioxygenase superfamily protein [Thermomonospora umbrina]
MIGRIDEVVVDCADPGPLARFWAGVLGGDPVDRDADWSYVDTAGGLRIAFQRVPEPKLTKNRLHLDIAVDDIGPARERLLSAGATARGEVVVDDQGAFQVMRDPEGNEFCLVH